MLGMKKRIYIPSFECLNLSVDIPENPVALKERLKNEFDQLTQRKVISPIQEPADWLSSMIATKKPDGNIRLCIACMDPRHLNRALT